MAQYINIPAVHFVYDKKKLKQVMRQVGAEIARNDRQQLRQAAGQGRLYGKHRASAPGAAAARVSGDLARSVKSKLSRSGDSVTVKEGVFYAKMLEAGATGGGNRDLTP